MFRDRKQDYAIFGWTYESLATFFSVGHIARDGKLQTVSTTLSYEGDGDANGWREEEGDKADAVSGADILGGERGGGFKISVSSITNNGPLIDGDTHSVLHTPSCFNFI